MKFLWKKIAIAGLSALLTVGVVNKAVAALSLAEQADRTGEVVSSGLVGLSGLDIVGKGSLLVRAVGITVKARPMQVENSLASLIGQVSYNKASKYKLGLGPRDTLDRVRDVWKLREGIVMTILLEGGKTFHCTVIDRGRALSCDEEPVSKG